MKDQSHSNEGCLTLFAMAFTGAGAGAPFGAFLLSLFQYLYYVIFKPHILHDGQWVLVFLVTIPLGGIIGAILGAIIGIFILRRKR